MKCSQKLWWRWGGIWLYCTCVQLCWLHGEELFSVLFGTIVQNKRRPSVVRAGKHWWQPSYYCSVLAQQLRTWAMFYHSCSLSVSATFCAFAALFSLTCDINQPSISTKSRETVWHVAALERCHSKTTCSGKLKSLILYSSLIYFPDRECRQYRQACCGWLWSYNDASCYSHWPFSTNPGGL